ncbi:DinB family protein [Fodinibius salsisoli]|uniref:DinB family protein n=1 Tax=Fodinibius salsisoli TaxID=2820877 RepID=A0ABT3PR74_9BACT|nr:DinB family protein [Fodinibius salsisoli]MCW9708330.1 DinB family protein [Fodinibius salsisoli]
MKHSAIQQYDYHQWANNRFFEHLKQLPAGLYTQEVESVFSSIAEVISHIYRVDGMWLSVMSGDSFEETMQVIKKLETQSDGKGLELMQRLNEALAQRYATFFKQQDPDEIISVEHPRYGALETSVANLVQHVVNHGTYHRGNITAMLRQQGEAGIPTDYVFYLYEQT